MSRDLIAVADDRNLATYATLFGLSWLEPLMWSLQRWLYAKTRLTLCPSPSTRDMLEQNAFGDVRLWPRGVDLEQFGPRNRSQVLRDRWGVAPAPIPPPAAVTTKPGADDKAPPTPPMSPVETPVASLSSVADGRPNLVLLYVGRLSWEKNLLLLLRAYALLPVRPKLVFVGDGPARGDLAAHCKKHGYDALFTGHLSGPALAAAYASADVFAFPSFTETFGQVVLEALASGLPVVGLDAEGTRDLVAHGHTGLLLPLPFADADLKGGWHRACATPTPDLVERYASLLAEVLGDASLRARMGAHAASDGIRGFTWWDAMEACVDSYRESMRAARAARTLHVRVDAHAPAAAPASLTPAADAMSPTLSPNLPPRLRRQESRRISRVNRVVSRRLARKESEESTAGLVLKTFAKLTLGMGVFWYVWARHLSQNGRQMGWDEVFRLRA